MKTKKSGLFGLVFGDTIVNVLAIFFLLFILVAIIPKHISDNKKAGPVLGTLCVELSWDNDRNVDLDLWGKSPTDETPVGYSNMHGLNLDLYRDVLGFLYNPSHQNLEVMCSKELVQGEWVFNVSYYKNHDDTDPKNAAVEATMTITFNRNAMGGGVDKEFYTTKYTVHIAEEKTMFDFRLDKEGKIIAGSMNTLDQHLRSPL